MIRAAFDFSLNAHGEQVRKSGEPYITHPLRVALSLAEWGMDNESIAAGLLHDVVEDCGVAVEELEESFGPDIAQIVEGVTKIGQYHLSKSEHYQIVNFRKMILAMAEDLRVIIVKLADRLHNMQTIRALELKRQKLISEETLHIYAPIAERLGMWGMMAELEDLAFDILMPDEYARLSKDLDELQPRAHLFFEKIKRKLLKQLAGEGLHVSVQARMKHLYSIHKKMERKGYNLERLHDIFAFRVITDSREQCYEILGILHAEWKVMPGRLKDYIAQPKPNAYSSIHSTLLSPQGVPFEVQIRTEDMHRIAEEGVTAHVVYKKSVSSLKEMQKEMVWIQRLKEVVERAESMEHIKEQLSLKEIFVLTPGGDIVALPEGATILDFAYRIHTDVGHHTTGGQVSGRMLPLATVLSTGDRVKILTHPRQRPSRDWLNFVTTSAARGKIRQYILKKEKLQAIECGKKSFARFLKKYDLDQEEIIRSDLFAAMLQRRGWPRNEDFFFIVGQRKVELEEFLSSWLPAEEEELQPVAEAAVAKRDRVLVGGEDDLEVGFPRCCFPVPGDPIGALVTKTRGIVIHRKSCDCLRGKGIYSAEWAYGRGSLHPLKMTIVAEEYAKVMAEISKECVALGVVISDLHHRNLKYGHSLITMTIMVRHTNGFLNLRGRLSGVPGVVEISRSGERR